MSRVAITKNKRRTIGYICGTDWDTEIPWATSAGFPDIYRSQAALKRDRSCWRECGIVEIEIKFVRQVRKGKL